MRKSSSVMAPVLSRFLARRPLSRSDQSVCLSENAGYRGGMTRPGWTIAAMFAALLYLVPATAAATIAMVSLAMVGMAFPPGRLAHAQIARRPITRRAPP